MKHVSILVFVPRRLRNQAVIASVLTICASAFGDDWNTYDACLGTLPQQQGWTLVDPATVTPPSNCLLHVGPTPGGCQPTGGYRYWYKDNLTGGPTISFDVGGFVAVEWELSVQSSSYNNTTAECGDEDLCDDLGTHRVGYEVAVFDSITRHFFVGYARTANPRVSGIYLDTEGQFCPGNTEFKSWQQLGLDPGGLHSYRFIVSDGVGKLFVNDHFAMQKDVSNTLHEPANANRVAFGDGSYVGSAETTLKFLRYTVSEAKGIPAVSTWSMVILFVLAATAASVIVRRKLCLGVGG